MMENSGSRTYEQAFDVSYDTTQPAGSKFFDDDGHPKRTGNQITSKIQVF